MTFHRAWPLLVALFVASCGGGNESAGNFQQAQAIRVTSVPLGSAEGVTGAGDLVVTSHVDSTNAGASTGFRQMLNVYRQSSTNPDVLTTVSSVYLGVDTLYKRLSDLAVTNEWATATINYNFVAEATVALVPLQPSVLPATTYDFMSTLDRALAHGRWLVVTTTTNVWVYDIVDLSMPVLARSATLSSTPSSITPVANGFLLMTQNGYAFVNVANPQSVTVSEAPHDDLRASAKVYRSGDRLYVGGPSRHAGRSKVARVDVTNPAAPVVVALNDQVDGTFVDFAHDGDGRYFLRTGNAMHLLSESGAAIVHRQTVAMTPRSVQPTSRLFASRGRFFIAEGDLTVYRMP